MNKVIAIKKIINCGGTIEDAAAKFGVVSRTITNWLKASYKSEKCYHKLLEKARINKLAKKHAEISAQKEAMEIAKIEREEEIEAMRNAISKGEDEMLHKVDGVRKLVKATKKKTAKKVAVVCETGYLIEVGYEGIWGIEAPMYLPAFCYNEIEKKMQDENECRSEKIKELLLLDSTFSILKPFSLRTEKVFRRCSNIRKKRSIGIVAVCCALTEKERAVILLTNSREVAEFAALQECGIVIVKI